MEASDNRKQDVQEKPGGGAEAAPLCDSLWINARMATMTGNGYGILEDGALGIKEGRITWVGPMSELRDVPDHIAPKVHDAGGKWMTPGLIDCHTHLVYGGNRSNEFALRLAGKSYEEIAKSGGGINATVRATREMSEEELFRASEKRLRAFLKEGVTTIEIKSGYGLDTENEIKMLRVARKFAHAYAVNIYTTFLGAHSLPPEYAGRADDYIAMVCDDTLPAIAREHLADAVDGYCESIAFTPDQMMKLFTAAGRLGLPVKLHAGQFSDMGGAELAARYKALSADHLEYVNEDAIGAMARAGTVAVLLPGAFYTLKEKQKPPVDVFRQYNVPMALATDCNPGTSPVCSLLLMMNMGCNVFGLRAEEALLAVTAHAARALGAGDRLGTLEAGKIADMALWDISHPSELVYHLGYNPCIGVIFHGQFMEVRERLS